MPRPKAEGDEELKKTSVEVEDREEEEEPKEVSVDSDDDEDDPSDDQPTRAQKRANRYREARAAAQAAEKRADEAEKRAQQEAQGRSEALRLAQEHIARQQQPAQPQQDPWAHHAAQFERENNDIKELARVYKEAGKYDAEFEDKLNKRYYDWQGRYNQFITQREIAIHQMRQQQQAPQNQQSAAQAAWNARFQAEFPDVVGHPAAMAHMMGGWQQEHAAANHQGKQLTWEDIQRIVNNTRRAFGMIKSPPPSAATKARFSGSSGGSPSHGSNGNGRTISMTKEYKLMAHARYPDLEPEQAEQKWAKTVGKRLLEKESS